MNVDIIIHTIVSFYGFTGRKTEKIVLQYYVYGIPGASQCAACMERTDMSGKERSGI